MHLVWRHVVTMRWNTSHVCNINQGDGTQGDGTKIRTHIWLIPKPNTLCLTLTLTVWYLALLMERGENPHWPCTSLHVLPLISLDHPNTLSICPLPSLSPVFSSPPISSFPSFTFCFSHSLVSFLLVFHVPKPILCTGHAKLDEIHTPSLKISPFD